MVWARSGASRSDTDRPLSRGGAPVGRGTPGRVVYTGSLVSGVFIAGMPHKTPHKMGSLRSERFAIVDVRHRYISLD